MTRHGKYVLTKSLDDMILRHFELRNRLANRRVKRVNAMAIRLSSYFVIDGRADILIVEASVEDTAASLIAFEHVEQIRSGSTTP